MKTALFAFLWLVTISLNAQSNYGIIGGHLSSEGKAVSGANVVIQKTKLATVTDSTGFFEIKNIAAGKYTLQATYVGSQKIELQVMVGAGKETKVDASFRHISANLNDVVVTGDLQPLDKSKSIASIDVLTVKDFERTPVTNVFDALTYAKGIFCDIDQGLTNPIDVNINGLEGNYTMFTIDGVPAMNNIAGIFALSAFPVSMVDNIQIEKGSNSTVYGSDAVGGVVNISTKDPATAPRLSLNATLYSKLESELGLTATFHLKKVNTLFSVSSDNMNYRWDIDHDGFMDLPLVNRNSIFNKWSFIR
ncbi:MAG: TonB-dependent receptor plug, partial [Bacteroidota bacterium]|nr:TonB-dependent receptor plug [Bacteroidota bacterium]